MATERDCNSYEVLKSNSPQACDICNRTFHNRYNSIVHNSSHIIIPLLKHQIFYCEICYNYHSSTDNFNTHMHEKHHPVLNTNNNIDIRVPKIKLEKLPQFNRDALVKEEFDGNEYDSSSDDETLLEIVKRETERNYRHNEINDEDYADIIKSNLKFEVDTEHDRLLNDFTTDCEVNIQYMWSNKNKDTNTSNGIIRSITNCIVYEDPIDEFEFNNDIFSDVTLKSDDVYESIHYSDLMSFGFFSCKYCYAFFSNRFSLIIHETSHIRIKNIRNQYLRCPQCDAYIAGNYRTVQKHEAAVHGDKRDLRTCDICGLKYRKYTRHKQNYHPKIELLNGLKKKMVKDLVETVQEPIKKPVQVSVLGLIQEPAHNLIPKGDWFEKFFTITVCDLCFSFFKNSFKKVYILKGTFSYTTERPCYECKKLFKKLKTVRIIIRIHNSLINRGRSSTLTNENRLKKIQTRLKMINKLGKVYKRCFINIIF